MFFSATGLGPHQATSPKYCILIVCLSERERERDYITPAACSSPTQSGQWRAESGRKYGYTFQNLTQTTLAAIFVVRNEKLARVFPTVLVDNFFLVLANWLRLKFFTNILFNTLKQYVRCLSTS